MKVGVAIMETGRALLEDVVGGADASRMPCGLVKRLCCEDTGGGTVYRSASCVRLCDTCGARYCPSGPTDGRTETGAVVLDCRVGSGTLWSYVRVELEVDGGFELPVDAFVELIDVSDELEKDTPRAGR